MRLSLFTSFAVRVPSPGGILLALDGRHLVFFALLLLGLCGSANAKRVALVIGNDQYQTIPKLSNARNDASLISGVLTKAGFAVTQANDLGRERLWSTIDAFKAGINKGDEVVFYFAGHGVQIGPAQLLLATDINSRTEAQLQRDGVPLVDVQDALKDARVAIFIIDACRDNPFPKQGLRSLGATRGLLPPEPSAGQIIMMSAGRNQKALDSVPGQTRANGLFTWELAQVIQTPGIEIRSAMERVKDAVDDKARAANHEQRPSLVNDLRGNFYFFASPVAGTDNIVRPNPVVVAPVMTAAQLEEKFWDDAKAAGNKEAFEAYLINYPTGRYANLAKANIARLSPSVQVVSAPPVVAPVITPPVTKPVITTPARLSGGTFKDCPDCPEMVVIPAGRFVMGAAPGEEESEKLSEKFRNRSQPQHGVDVSGFSVGKFEVTRGQYRAFVEATGRSSAGGCSIWTGSKFEIDREKNWRNPGYWQDDPHPVACVSWDDAKAYMVWLSQRTGKAYRLLMEAEWEYAARAGTTTRRFWGDDGHQSCAYANGADQTTKAQVPGWIYQTANCNDRYTNTAPVGSYRANAFGLYDMLGNVGEWTEDCWNENYNGAPTDARAWTAGNCSQRVVRGGSWFGDPQNLRAASRYWDFTAVRANINGFRVARTN